MTREEAIKRLKSDIYEYADFTENPNENEFWMAFDMAIKALEAPPNDNWEGYSKRLWKSAYEYGKADAEQRWIPVSERLPEEDKQVLVTECFTTISGEKIYSISLANFYGDDWVTVHDEYKIDPSRHKVIAWRELPETYKAESEEVRNEMPIPDKNHS